MTLIEVEPQPRVDTLVRLPGGGEARRTDYAGVVWFDGKPEAAGMLLRRAANAPKGIRTPNVEASFYLPDSLPYSGAALAGAGLSVSVALCGSGEVSAVTRAAATFAADPSGEPTWIQLYLQGHLGWPAGVSYRVVAVTPPDAVLQG
ncbi:MULTISPECIES: hypothetical protein [Mycobacteriaceae]|uniref:hypothetical protein n=1 Tax=Mycobacteriaceae TaxID=1762 RepID=UPI001CA326A5|nr:MULTISPECIES: hypothetical protein [Mycobacteriaceae]QZT60847.1 hypothetical protein JN085_17600 [Mycolicibacterium austroafricanum]UXA13891.1 hypothetical protein KXD97_08990 [Mycobacterium sp. SMC-8]